MRFRLCDLSTYRTALMGVAALMIIACHAPAYGVFMPQWVRKLAVLGNYGVDIFLLLSGLGCYYSLRKQGSTTCGFYKKRVVRIFIPYMLVFIPANILFILLGERNVGEGFLSLATIEYWIFHKGAWFVSMIIILYLISPFLVLVQNGKYKWFVTFGIILVVFGICSIPVKDPSNLNVVYNIQWAFRRSPSFFIGIALAQDCMENKTMSVVWPLVLAMLFIPARKLLFWVDNSWFVVPLMTLSLAVLLKWTCQMKAIELCLEFMGKISLESYLLNICLNSLLRFVIPGIIDSKLFYGHLLDYSFVIVAGVFLAYATSLLSKRIIARFAV